MIRAGQKLKEVRLKKGLTIEDVAKATKIKVSFLAAIEKGDYAKLPSVAYAQGFVRNYAIYLGVSTQELLAIFRREFDDKKAYKILPKGFSEDTNFSTRRFPMRTLFIGVILFLGLFTYIFFQYKYAIINPPLTVEMPQEKQEITKQEIVISGKTDPNVTLYVNSIPVSLDESGKFAKTISVFPGSQTITIKAVSRFGREKVIERHIEVKPQ